MAGSGDTVSGPVQRWSGVTKRAVVWGLLAALILLLYVFREAIPQLVLAGVLAFIVEPAVRLLQRTLKLARTPATAIVFIVLVLAGLAVLAAPVTAVPAVQRAVRSIQFDFNRVVDEMGELLGRSLEIGDYKLDLSDFYGQLSTMLSRFATTVAEGTLDVVLGIASGAIQLLFVLIAAFYLVKDTRRLVDWLDGLAPPGYRDDFVRLRRQITDAWSAFLRSQLLLGVVVGVITTMVCAAVGLPYPWALGLIAGLLEVIPHIGPFIAAIPAVLLALFVGSSYLPLRPFWLALLVAGLYLLIQQVENSVLVPRILGRSLDLHPLMVLVAAVIGGKVAGVLGILLAPPILATLRVVGRYVLNRLYDRDPFAEPVERTPSPQPERRQARHTWSLAWLRREAKGQDPESVSDGANGPDSAAAFERSDEGGTSGGHDDSDSGRDR